MCVSEMMLVVLFNGTASWGGANFVFVLLGIVRMVWVKKMRKSF